jgi:hypothetical protein
MEINNDLIAIFNETTKKYNVVSRTEYNEEYIENALNEGSIQNVYEEDGAYLIPRPEVRVERKLSKQEISLLKSVASHSYSEEYKYTTIVVTSNRGEDAIYISSQISESAVRYQRIIINKDKCLHNTEKIGFPLKTEKGEKKMVTCKKCNRSFARDDKNVSVPNVCNND